MKLLTWITLIFCFPTEIRCQDTKITDSLTQVLKAQSAGDRYLTLHRLAAEYVDKDNQKAFEIIEQAEESALLFGDTLSIVKSKRAKGQILFRLGKTSEVISTYELIYPIAQRKNFIQECMSIANTLGAVYFMRSQFDQALRYHFQAYEFAISGNDSSAVAMVLNNIGTTYYKLKDYAKGLEYLKRGYEIDQAIDEVAYDTPMNVSLCYVHLHDFKNAKRYLDESLKACGAKCPDYAMVHISYTMACLFFGLKQFDAAEAEFVKSYSLAKKLNNSRMQLDNIYFLAEIYFERSLIPKALKYLQEGEDIMDKGIPFNLEMIKIYSRLAEYHLLTNNFKKASFYQQRYIQLKDSIYNEAVTLNLMRIEAESLERENKKRLKAQNELITLNQLTIQRQEVLNIVATLLGLITLTFSIFLHRTYRQKKKLNLLLEEKIRARTSELEISRDNLINAGLEESLKVGRAFEVISVGLNTIQGLCLTGMKENVGNLADSYLSKIQKTAFQLNEKLKLTLEGGGMKKAANQQ